MDDKDKRITELETRLKAALELAGDVFSIDRTKDTTDEQLWGQMTRKVTREIRSDWGNR